MEKGPKTKAVWDSSAHKVFFEICKEEVRAGNRPMGYLNATGYKNLQNKFFARTGRNYVKMQFKNRWDSLKKEYENWLTFTEAATGLPWDSELGTIDADDEWWAKHTETHPESAKFRYGRPQNLADLIAVFGKAHVTGATSAVHGEHIEDPTNLVEVEDDDDNVETNKMEEGPKTKAVWDSSAHKVFCEICTEEISAGNRPKGYLNATGYKNLQNKFFARTGRNYVKMQFKNRWDALKKEYENWLTFTESATGLPWDIKLGTIDANDEWWAKHTETHPESAKFRYGRPHNLGDLIALFGKAHVTGATSAVHREHIEYSTNLVEVEDGDDNVQTYKMQKGPKTKAVWDSSALKVFCEICTEEISAGNRPKGYLNATGYKNLQNKFFARTGRNYVKMQFKNRWDALKKEYESWLTFTEAATGLPWDGELGTVDADDEWWAKHTKIHPESAKFRNGPPQNLADLVAVFGKAHVTGATSAVHREHIEDPTNLVEVEDGDGNVETNKAASKSANVAEKRRSLPVVASPKKKQKERAVREFRTMANVRASSTSVTSCNDAVPRGHGIKDVIKLAVQAGAKECTALFFTATKLFMNPDYRELFSALETNEGRLDWLERMHEEMMKN